jgi:ATP-dependent DNA ligase
MQTFPELSTTDSKNKTRVWNIWVENKDTYSLIITEYGVKDGKMIHSEIIITDGKNLNKSNSTSHYTQAISQAQSKHEKKQTSSNYRNIETETKNESEPVCLPMLAQDYSKHVNKVIFPTFCQPKLDGNRAVYNNDSKKITSRTGKEWTSLENTELYKELLDFPFVCDGELYCHDPDFKFESLGILRKKKLSSKDYINLNKIEYWIYDIVDTTKTFVMRNKILKDFFVKNTFLKLKYVTTELITDKAVLDKTHGKYISEGYEGTMVRNSSGMYKLNYRSPDLLKKKDFIDDEFVIIGYSCEKSHLNNNEYVIWKCKTNDNKEFNVQSSGTATERMNSYKNAEKYIGSLLSVKFFEYTENNIPRFPKYARDTLKNSIRNEII